MNYKHSYLVRIQYLGFRLHGWQKQPNLKTVHFILDKTLKFVFKGIRCKSVGVGRTDAKVSSTDYPFRLFIDEPVDNASFLSSFNKNSPADIRALSIEEISDEEFNIIQSPKIKEYHYYFSTAGKNHPYAAPFLIDFGRLNVEEMKKGAQLFSGTHYFGLYCTKPSKDTVLMRTIDSCEIVENNILTANFFPEESFVLKVCGKGFLRYQIRLMMGALVELGRGNLSLNDIEESLIEKIDRKDTLANIAPGSGLHLYNVEFLS
ncbi:tRNA pseudouridine(38-40) synthase TruA [Flavobacteriaceae bacterium S356]|uniref:tRNA pseudouridine synthase A n=1 Tax=Asprobacillus argus TaxID=3076534 RepID=A0ABU3LIC9_9FLAO|nr:tRNA pseudouridine(38-40) synthase TruA [Flavobacteriaceae bacterium S356]